MTTKVVKLKASLAFIRYPDGTLVPRLYAIHDGVSANTAAFSTPPTDMPTFKTNIDSLATLVSEALDGGKKAVAVKNKQRAVVIQMAEHLAHYVEANSNNDLATFTSSGFEVAPKSRVPPQPLPTPVIGKVDQGNTGQLIVSFVAIPKALAYELHYAAIGAGNTPGPWTLVLLTNAKAAPVDGLTPGTTYSFQLRAIGKLGYTDWSDPINRMSI